MITGPILDSKSWFSQMDLSNHLRMVLMDNRDSGMSDRAQVPYTIETMADDVRSLLRKLKVDRAHVLGFSMGGMVAQALALLYPANVKSLILVSTSCSGRDTVLVDLPLKEEFSHDDLASVFTKFFSEGWLAQNKEIYSKLTQMYARDPSITISLRNQLLAMAMFDACRRINQISAPVTIIQGEEDRVISSRNSQLLHGGIYNSRLLLFKGAGHAVHIERPRDFNREVLRHIDLVRKGLFRRETLVV